jgi:hypothetical protein
MPPTKIPRQNRWPGRYTPEYPLLVSIVAAAEQCLPSLLDVEGGARVLRSVADFLEKRTGDGETWYIEDPNNRIYRFRFHTAGKCGNYIVQDTGFSRGSASFYRKGTWRLMAPPTWLSNWYGFADVDPEFDPLVEPATLFRAGQVVSEALYGIPAVLPPDSKSIVVPFPRGTLLEWDELGTKGWNEGIGDRLIYYAAMVWRFGPVEWDREWCARWGFDPLAKVIPSLSVGGTIHGVPYPPR